MRASTRKVILLAVLSGVTAYVAFDASRDGLSTGGKFPAATKLGGPRESVSSSQGAGSEERAGRFALPDRVPLGEPRAELFGPHSWQPSAPKDRTARAIPAVPPMPYRFAGKLVQQGQTQIFLSKGDSVVAVREGDTLDGGYRVESIGEAQITLVYLPLKHKETIPIYSSLPLAGAQVQAAPAQVISQATPGAAPSGPVAGPAPGVPIPTASVVADPSAQNKTARLVWEGPQHVRLGTQFSVALRVTSAQPVRASPMQLKFDPSLLEAVAVKPGRFFGPGDRNFSYRVSPDGSIFVGASNQGPVPAADAEFVVLTFKALKPASAAELSIASLNLQGSAGRAIAFDQLSSFKTAITP